MKHLFLLLFTITLCGCGIVKGDLPDNYFVCEHKYDKTRSFLVESEEDVTFITAESCGILMVNGECPIVIKVETVSNETLFLSENELENYETCKFKENIQ